MVTAAGLWLIGESVTRGADASTEASLVVFSVITMWLVADDRYGLVSVVSEGAGAVPKAAVKVGRYALVVVSSCSVALAAVSL